MKHKVMIVDDSRLMCMQLKNMMEESGKIEVVGQCRSGKEALERYEELQPDLVTLDIVLPDMDGIQVCKEMKQRWPNSRILILSSMDFEDTIESAEKAGAIGFLDKCLDYEALEAAMFKAFGD